MHVPCFRLAVIHSVVHVYDKPRIGQTLQKKKTFQSRESDPGKNCIDKEAALSHIQRAKLRFPKPFQTGNIVVLLCVALKF